MKKKITSLLLALVLCLGLLPTATLAAGREYPNRWRDEFADFVLSAEEAARDYGITVSTSHIDLGSAYIGEEIDPVVFTLTNNSDYYIAGGILASNTMNWFTHSPSGSSGYVYFDEVRIAPGESKDIQARYGRTDHGRSGPETVDLYVCLDTRENIAMDRGLIRLYIKDILTVDYEIKDPDKEIPAGDIQWDLSTTALDLGVSNVTKRSNYLLDEYLTGIVTVTNRGSRPMRVESRLDTSGCSWETIEYIISGDSPAGEYLRPGESTDIKIKLQRSSWYETGTIEGCKLNLTAYYPDYPDSREENTLTASIPITAKFLSDGGHVLYFNGDNSEEARAFDAQGNELTLDSRVLVVKEGDTVTFVAVPPVGFYVSELLVDKKNVGAVDHYTFTNIRSSHEIAHHVGRGPAPYTPYVPGQPPVTPTDPAEQKPSEAPSLWAQADVDQAKALGILPTELQSAYVQPITRAQFCTLADALYTAVKGSPAPADAAVTFTDTTDAAVLRMASAKVVNGVGEGKFDPNGQLTREQAATMLSRLSAALGKPLTAGMPTFGDSGSVASWAREAVGQMQASGVMGGTGGNQFSPKQSYTREQSIVTIMRLYGMVK